ncbi:9102_t:CDS:1, partial [Paraglomus occultum]
FTDDAGEDPHTNVDTMIRLFMNIAFGVGPPVHPFVFRVFYSCVQMLY